MRYLYSESKNMKLAPNPQLLKNYIMVLALTSLIFFLIWVKKKKQTNSYCLLPLKVAWNLQSPILSDIPWFTWAIIVLCLQGFYLTGLDTILVVFYTILSTKPKHLSFQLNLAFLSMEFSLRAIN